MTITKNVSNYNDILLDIQTQSGTISQQPTSSFNKNNIRFWYICYFANKSGLGFFSGRSFFMPIWQFDKLTLGI